MNIPVDEPYNDVISDNEQKRFMEKPTLKTFVSKIREQVILALLFTSLSS